MKHFIGSKSFFVTGTGFTYTDHAKKNFFLNLVFSNIKKNPANTKLTIDSDNSLPSF